MWLMPWMQILSASIGTVFIYKLFAKFQQKKQSRVMPPDYFVGLNYLFNEQPDKAVDIFIKLLDVNHDTLETHLALGHLFRRRGEVDRAIRIHQNLVARSELTISQRTEALFALGQDYLSSGMLDRAERLFLEINTMQGETKILALRALMTIYQQEKSWQQAINTGEKYLLLAQDEQVRMAIAHYYCELATQANIRGEVAEALSLLEKSKQCHLQCARIYLMQAQLHINLKEYVKAIQFLKCVTIHDSDYLSETIAPLELCYQQTQTMAEYVQYLQVCFQHQPRATVLLALAKHFESTQGAEFAANYLQTQLHDFPSLKGLGKWIELQCQAQQLLTTPQNLKNPFIILKTMMQTLLVQKPWYRCIHCGFSSKVLYWLCPGCHHWHSCKPIHGIEGD